MYFTWSEPPVRGGYPWGLGWPPMTLHNLVPHIFEDDEIGFRAACPVTTCPWVKEGPDPNTLQDAWSKHARKTHSNQGRFL